MKWAINRWMIGATLLWALPVLASSGSKLADGVNYIPVTPALVVNYGGPGSKPRYIRVEISIRTETAEDAAEVTHHLPLIRDRLISIISSQTEERIGTSEGKEYVRLYALSEINKALLAVEGHTDDSHSSMSSAGSSHNAKTSTSAMTEEGKPALSSVADIKPVKGPASDLFFNNFVVQR